MASEEHDLRFCELTLCALTVSAVLCNFICPKAITVEVRFCSFPAKRNKPRQESTLSWWFVTAVSLYVVETWPTLDINESSVCSLLPVYFSVL